MSTESEGSCSKNDSSDRKSIKILILGDYDIGKTALINLYIDMDHITMEELDVFDVYHLRTKHNGNEVNVELIDLDCNSKSFQRRKCYPTDVNIILLCFSIGHYKTLKSIYNLWIHEVRAHFGKLVPVLLVGLKSDFRLVDPVTYAFFSSLQLENDRLVEKCEAEIIHKNYHFQGDYMECSIYDLNSVNDVMQKAFLAAMED